MQVNMYITTAAVAKGEETMVRFLLLKTETE